MDVDEALRRSPLYRDLAPSDRKEMARICCLETAQKGEYLFREGDSSEFFFSVITGTIKVHKTLASGREVILSVFGPGSPVGAVAAYAGRPYPASAEALEGSVCLKIRTRGFLELLERRPALVRALLQALTRRLLQFGTRFSELADKCEVRLALLFLRLADHVGKPSEEGTWIPIRLQRQDLADLTGMTSETCIRIMRLWDQRAILRTEHGGFLLLDRDALETRALRS